jgi:hypothetical protein
MFGLLLSEVTVTSKFLCWTWTKIYDGMITACLTVATAVCVLWQDQHILTVAMQSVAQCVTYHIVVISQKLYVLNDTQFSVLFTLHEPKQHSTALQTVQETVVQVLCYLSKFHVSPNKRCPASLMWVMSRRGRRKNWMVKIENVILFNSQPDTLYIQIYSVIKLYMFWATSLPQTYSVLWQNKFG